MADTRLTAVNRTEQTRTVKSYRGLAAFWQANSAVRIGMLSNPLSGGNRKGFKQIRQTAAATRPRVLQREVHSPSEVDSTLADFARREINVLVVNGGDGTVQAVLTSIFHQKPFETVPLLAVLRSAGTTSMIAGDIGLKGIRHRALQRLFSWSRTQNNKAAIAQRPVLRVQVPGEVKPVYTMFLGAAGIYQATHFYHRKIHTIGLRGEVGPGVTLARFAMASILGDRKVLSPVPITTRVDHNPPEARDYLLVFVTTLERLFLGLRPFWGTESKPLHYTAIGSHPYRFVRLLPFLLKGRQLPNIMPANGYISHNANRIQLSLNSGFTLDGQLYRPACQQEPVVVTGGGPASFLQL
jgi:diacylglycerol kinase (ATP)